MKRKTNGKNHLEVKTIVVLSEQGKKLVNVIIDKIVSAMPNQFDLKLVLRDENLPLIDEHLTNGGRAIPVLLVLDEKGNLIMPKWGPRPQVLQDLMASWKKENLTMEVIAEQLHGWYAKDKTQAIQQELSEILKQIN